MSFELWQYCQQQLGQSELTNKKNISINLYSVYEYIIYTNVLCELLRKC